MALDRWAGRLATERSPSADGPANGAFNAEEREENGGDCRGANGVFRWINLDVRAADAPSEPSDRSEPSAFQLRRSRTRTEDGALPDPKTDLRSKHLSRGATVARRRPARALREPAARDAGSGRARGLRMARTGVADASVPGR